MFGETVEEWDPSPYSFRLDWVDQDNTVILPEINRLENWISPALITDGDENEEIEIYRAADYGDPQTGRERRACA